MPRPRGTEAPQRPSPRAHLRVTGSDSDPSHRHRPFTERSPKLGDRLSPRGSQSEPVTQKKLGTRISDLESQLGQAQNELKSLKDQLVSAEAAKKEAQEKLEKKTKKPPPPPPPAIKPRKPSTRDIKPDDDDALEETDAFKVPIKKPEPEPEPEPESEEMKSLVRESGMKDEEIESLRSKLSKKEKESESLGRENEALKCQLAEAGAYGEETGMKLRQARDELEESKAESGRLSDQLKFVEEAREGLEAEMKKIRVQTEQWRKAADAAAAVLSGGINGSGRIPGRCGSMDKHYISGSAFVGSPEADDVDDEGGKRKGSGMKMFGDLWRKKGQK